MLFRSRLTLLLALAAGSFSAPLLADPIAKSIASLDKSEPFEGMTFHDGLLWVGRSRLDFNSNYRLDMYDRNDQLAGSVTFPHAANFVHPYGTHSVIVIGTGYSPNLTNYTIVEHTGATFAVHTHQIPMDAWANRWVGTLGGREYFTDPGGNVNDPASDQDPNLPAQTIFTMGSSGRPQYLTTRLRMPIGGTKVGSVLYLLHGESMADPRTNLVRLDPQTGAMTSAFDTFRNDLTALVQLPGTTVLALAEAGANQVLFYDTATQALRGTATVEGRLRSLTAFGHCVLAGSDETRSVTALDFADVTSPRVVATLTVDLTTDEFHSLNKVEVDATNGRVYARSNFPCNPMMQICNAEWNRVISFTGVDADKIAVACR